MSEEEGLVPYVAKGEIVSEDAWKLVYWRHFVKYEEGFPTLDEALGFTYGMADAGSGAPDYVVRPDGSFLEGEEFEAAQRRWEDAHGV